MLDFVGFAELVSVVAGVVLVALLVEPVAERIDVAAPLLFLGGGLALGLGWSAARGAVDPARLTNVGTLALVVILCDGGLRSGWRRVRSELRPVLAMGLGGTLATFALVGAAAHWLLGMEWEVALIVGAALAPTDPAAVFSVLADRRVSTTRVPTLLEGEAGFNDPIGIALAVALIEGATHAGASVVHIAVEIAREGALGAAIGIAGALLVDRLLGPRRPTPGLTPPLAVLAGAFAVYGVTTQVHGSGFLAAYLFGLVLGDRLQVPDRKAITHLYDGLASLAEIGMFVLLGVALTRVNLGSAWADALILAAVLALLVRPLVGYPLLRAFRFGRSEAAFGVWGGLKGAVPILLGSLPLAAGMSGGAHLFALVGLVVLFTLVLQGLTLGRVLRLLGVAE